MNAAILSPGFLDQQQVRLEELREQLLGGEQKAIADDRTALQVRGDEPEDVGDKAATMAQYEITQALHDVDQRRVSDIERALEKIRLGTYGLSDVSGDPIPKARLDVIPEAILTFQEEERREIDVLSARSSQ